MTKWHQIMESPDGRFVLILMCLALVVMALWSTVATLIETWSYTGFRHGYIVPLISGYLLWTERETLVKERWRPTFLGLAVLTGALLIWTIANITMIQVIEHSIFVVIVAATVWALFGPKALQRVAFPVGFLLFAVPIGVEIIPLLMDITASASAAILRGLGTSVYHEGYYLVLPAGTFEVAAACSGFQYLYSGIAISVLIGYVSFTRQLSRLLFVVVSAVCLILLNWLRVIIVIGVASASNMTLFTGDDHIWFGTFLYMCALLLQLYVVSRVKEHKKV